MVRNNPSDKYMPEVSQMENRSEEKSRVNEHEGGEGIGASLMCEKAERAGTAYPREEKVYPIDI